MKRANLRRPAHPVGPEVHDMAVVEDSPQELHFTTVPPDWRKGALLNVRNYGVDYVVTLYPEEMDDRQPERALHFTNTSLCQDFVSAWYAHEHHDPRAR